MPALNRNPLPKQPIVRSVVVPESTEVVAEKTYKLRFGSTVDRCDKDKSMSFYGIEYTNLSYADLMLVQSVCKAIFEKALAEITTTMVGVGFKQADLVATDEQKTKMKSLMGGK